MIKKIIVLIVLLFGVGIFLYLPTFALTTDDYFVTGNIFSYNSPYTIVTDYEDGPNNDVLSITITGELSSLYYITFMGLDNQSLLDDVDYTSGSGFYSMITNGDTDTIEFQAEYSWWYALMSIDISTLDFDDDTLVLYFHYTLAGGVSASTFYNNFKNNVSIYFNMSLDLNELIWNAYESGVNDGIASLGDIQQNAYLYMYTYGAEAVGYSYNSTYDYIHGFGDGYTDGSSAIATFAIIPQALFTLGNFIFAIEISDGFTVGTLTMIPIAFYFFKWFLKMIGGKG